jgi:hypothetical protein
MPRLYGSSGKRFGQSKKVAAAASALRRAATIIRAKPSAILGHVRTGGFDGNYQQFKYRGNAGRELKFIDVVQSNSLILSAGLVTLLNGLAQGTDFNQRIGRKIVMTSILWNHGYIPYDGTSSPEGEIIRNMIIYDTQANSGSTPAVTDILVSADPFSAMNLNNRDRFKVLFDKRITMNPVTYTGAALTAGAPVTKFMSKYKKCAHDVIFSGTGATLGSIQTGSVLGLVVSTNNETTLLNQTTRIRFYDS